MRETVRGYEAAGIAGIQLEDQEVPKKCGHTPGRRVIPAEEMALKIRVAVEARRDPDFLIVARTDARTTLGLEEAIRRGRAFLEAGAPVGFVPGVLGRMEITALVDALGPRKLSVISVPGASLPVRELQELGVARVSTGPFTQRVALTALQDATAELLAGGVLPAGTRALN